MPKKRKHLVTFTKNTYGADEVSSILEDFADKIYNSGKNKEELYLGFQFTETPKKQDYIN